MVLVLSMIPIRRFFLIGCTMFVVARLDLAMDPTISILGCIINVANTCSLRALNLIAKHRVLLVSSRFTR